MTQSLMEYPMVPGCKTSTPDTSKAAAVAMEDAAGTLRKAVEGLLSVNELTADECADMLGQSVLSVRPRLSELRKVGRIEPTGARRRNDSGCSASVWRIVRNQYQGDLL